MMKKIKGITVLVTIVALNTVAILANTAGEAAAFTRFTLSPKAQSVGAAYSAEASGAEAIAWNPAAVGESNETECSIATAKYIESHYLRGDALFHIADWPIALGYLRADFSAVQHSTKETGQRVALLSSSSGYLGQRLSVGTAAKLSTKLALGAALTYNREDIGANYAAGIGLNVGLLARYNTLSWALSVDNAIEPRLSWNTSTQSNGHIARRYKVGLSKQYVGRIRQNIELQFRENRPVSLHAGLRVYPVSKLSVAFGVDDGDLTVGTGLHLPAIQTYVSWKQKDFDAQEDSFQVAMNINFINKSRGDK